MLRTADGTRPVWTARGSLTRNPLGDSQRRSTSKVSCWAKTRERSAVLRRRHVSKCLDQRPSLGHATRRASEPSPAGLWKGVGRAAAPSAPTSCSACLLSTVDPPPSGRHLPDLPTHDRPAAEPGRGPARPVRKLSNGNGGSRRDGPALIGDGSMTADGPADRRRSRHAAGRPRVGIRIPVPGRAWRRGIALGGPARNPRPGSDQPCAIKGDQTPAVPTVPAAHSAMMATNERAPAMTAHPAMARISGSWCRSPHGFRGSGTAFRRPATPPALRHVGELVLVELVNVQGHTAPGKPETYPPARHRQDRQHQSTHAPNTRRGEIPDQRNQHHRNPITSRSTRYTHAGIHSARRMLRHSH
jgi:hypothetical protein